MLQISPEELFFLGKQMQAKYIDYDYISMMKDIQQQYPLREKEIMAGLVSRGILTEDFSGEMELDEEIRGMLEPLFFGEFASEVVLSEDSCGENLKKYKFHFDKRRITGVQLEKDRLLFEADGSGELERLQKQVIPEQYEGKTEQIVMDAIKPDNIDRVLILKNMTIGKTANSSQFISLNGLWYIGKDENLVESLTKAEMEKRWKQMTRGE